MKKLLGGFAFASTVFLSGCGIGDFVYPDVEQEHAAIIVNTLDTNFKYYSIRATLISVDGRKAGKNDFLGGPVQVYVKPGRHRLKVSCSYNKQTNLPNGSEQTLTAELEANHTYRLVPKPLEAVFPSGPCRTVIKDISRPA